MRITSAMTSAIISTIVPARTVRPTIIRLRLDMRSTSTPAKGEARTTMMPWEKPTIPSIVREGVRSVISHWPAITCMLKEKNWSRLDSQYWKK